MSELPDTFVHDKRRSIACTYVAAALEQRGETKAFVGVLSEKIAWYRTLRVSQLVVSFTYAARGEVTEKQLYWDITLQTDEMEEKDESVHGRIVAGVTTFPPKERLVRGIHENERTVGGALDEITKALAEVNWREHELTGSEFRRARGRYKYLPFGTVEDNATGYFFRGKRVFLDGFSLDLRK